MKPAWKQYQEEAAEFFRSIELTAATDITLQGVRTTHDIDVLVTVNIAGFEVKWLVECKHWQTAVTKLHILAFRQIVADLGADRGILLCEVGFQSGAVEAANLTNVQVTSLSDLAISSRDAVYSARLRDLYDRTELCRVRYWDIPKDIRIDKGLRFDVGDGRNAYSGARILDACSEVLRKAFRGNYPIDVDFFTRLSNPLIPENLTSSQGVVAALEPLISDLEAKLNAV